VLFHTLLLGDCSVGVREIRRFIFYPVVLLTLVFGTWCGWHWLRPRARSDGSRPSSLPPTAVLAIQDRYTGESVRSIQADSPEAHNASEAEPEIVGSLPFRNQVHQALLLLKSRDTNAYAIVTNYVGRIQEGKRSGMWAYKTPPTYEISSKTAFHSLTWCTATIAHDSFHSKLYHDYRKQHAGAVPDAVWTGIAAERQCMKHQLFVMDRIGANHWEIEYAKKQADGHYAKDNETWEDYESRTW
jgi:hypothetical protein